MTVAAGGMIDRRVKWALILCAIAAALLAALDLAFPPPIEKARIVSPIVLDRDGRWIHAFATPEGRWRFRAYADEVDPVFVERLIGVEDKRFWRHPGVDPLALARACWSVARTGRLTSGASTITMQLARLLEPRPRTVPSKLIEMARALQIERRLDKRQILELYLTLAPYGGNLEGVRAASLSYFGKEPARLTDAEQALLIALPQAPESRRPDRRPAGALTARAAVLDELAVRGFLSPERAEEAEGAAMPQARLLFPRAAYHAALDLVQREGKSAGEIRSTLDLALQREAERMVAATAAAATDGATAAAIIIDVETREVLASVGSSGLTAEGGWIDLTKALRSPGSTLKPFIYALAFDDGLIGASTVIDDMPQSFDGYAPENFDRMFRGEVRAAEALQHSLNVPAVRILDRIGAERFRAMFSAAGVAVKTPDTLDGAGLTLALGGAGVSLRDIAALYAGLADQGNIAPLRWRTDEIEENERQSYCLVSRQSAEEVSAILASAPALEGRAPSSLILGAPRIAMKTGTSYGYRDAWAAGHAGGYAIVAWVGRADGAPRPGETGREAAAPLLAGLFDLVWRHDPTATGGARADRPLEPSAIARLSAPRRQAPPEIVFPRTGVELFASPGQTRGYALAARGGAGDYRWYVDGEDVSPDPASNRAVWRPEGAGFYEIVVVDAEGRSARSKVRVSMGS